MKTAVIIIQTLALLAVAWHATTLQQPHKPCPELQVQELEREYNAGWNWGYAAGRASK